MMEQGFPSDLLDKLLASLGMPPDMFGAPSANSPRGSYLETHYNAVWMGPQCGNVRASDPAFDGGIAEYRYWDRGASPGCLAAQDRHGRRFETPAHLRSRHHGRDCA